MDYQAICWVLTLTGAECCWTGDVSEFLFVGWVSGASEVSSIKHKANITCCDEVDEEHSLDNLIALTADWECVVYINPSMQMPRWAIVSVTSYLILFPSQISAWAIYTLTVVFYCFLTQLTYTGFTINSLVTVHYVSGRVCTTPFAIICFSIM